MSAKDIPVTMTDEEKHAWSIVWQNKLQQVFAQNPDPDEFIMEMARILIDIGIADRELEKDPDRPVADAIRQLRAEGYVRRESTL